MATPASSAPRRSCAFIFRLPRQLLLEQVADFPSFSCASTGSSGFIAIRASSAVGPWSQLSASEQRCCITTLLFAEIFAFKWSRIVSSFSASPFVFARHRFLPPGAVKKKSPWCIYPQEHLVANQCTIRTRRPALALFALAFEICPESFMFASFRHLRQFYTTALCPGAGWSCEQTIV